MWKNCKRSSWPLFCHFRYAKQHCTLIYRQISLIESISCFLFTITVLSTETCLHVAVISGIVPWPKMPFDAVHCA